MRAEFEKLGVPAFAREREAMLALRQLAAHSVLMRRKPAPVRAAKAPPVPAGAQRYLDEAESLALLAAAGITVVEHRLCRSEIEA